MLKSICIIAALVCAGRAEAQKAGPQPVPASTSCEDSTPCVIEGGFYHARLPAGWDGRPALPVLVYFHGYREEAKNIIADADLRAMADKHDVILVVPQGLNQTWSYQGSPSQARDDIAFIKAVLDDVEARFPVDRQRIAAAGFSQGASMVWNIACHAPERFFGFLPLSGGFWEPLPDSCKPAPRRILHIHGTADRTVPLAGRQLRGGVYAQGDIRKGWDILRRAAGCSEPSAPFTRDGRLSCEFQKSCRAGAAMELCLHQGGHDMDPSFLGLGLDWLNAEAQTGR